MREGDVLLVEDDAVQRRQMVRILKAEGYVVSESSTGEEAIHILSEKKIALVLTDKYMPDRDGLSLLRHIRSCHPGVPVVIMTGHTEENLDPQPDALLIKPFSSEDLRRMVRNLLV
jgi:CheY-like chemotaxis protein